jgi:hypothetical protein
MDPVKTKANFSRVCQLLLGKGGAALRGVLHAKHPASVLAAVLNANKKKLLRIKFRVITQSQWDLLFPVSGTPDSKNFDVTLLTILLRNVCGLPPPATGWDVMPPPGDISESANIARIKIYRNQVYGHIASPQLDDTTFETLWQEISSPLTKLRIPQQEIDELTEATLSPEEERYIQKLKEWKESEDEVLSKLNDLDRGFQNVGNEVLELRRIVENAVPLQVDKLAKFDFIGKINGLCKKFQDGTRKWLFDKLSTWLDDEESRVMILTAGPGVGKSVLSAKVCELYKQRDQLAAYHFCNFRNSDYSDPHRILQSLASQMCDNVEGFRDKLNEGLHREHSRESLSDVFRVLLNDPLHALDRHEPLLIVVDALDESKTDVRSEFLELISDEFPELPEWIKIFITSRPELQVCKKLQHLNPVEILSDNRHHKLDLECFIQHCLPNLDEGNVNFLISKCEGSFLYAYYVVNELKKRDLGIEPNLSDCVPKGISGFYENQFKRLRTGLKSSKPDTWSSILKCFLDVIAASRERLPIEFLFACIGLSSEEFDIRETITTMISEILPLYEGCLTVYHKSLMDWLRLDGYEEHAFLADVAEGNKRILCACKSIYGDINYLSSVADFQMSPKTRYALENGGSLLLDVGDTEDFHWLVNVRVNYLKFKFSCSPFGDFSRILRMYKSEYLNHILTGIIQLNAIIKDTPSDLYVGGEFVYLQYLANGYFDVAHNTNNYKNEARVILDATNSVWLEKVGNDSNSKFKIISDAIFGYPETSYPDSEDIALSGDNKLLACTDDHTFLEVFTLPTLTSIIQLRLSRRSFSSKFLIFSPDTSYLLSNSITSCISIRDQKEEPFIPHGPEDIASCSFSSCGTRLVTLETDFIKVWDVGTKDLLAKVKNDIKAKYCGFSNCNSYIFTANWEQFSFDKFALFNSRSLATLKAGEICFDTCLKYEDNYQVISPSFKDSCKTNVKLRIDHVHLPTTKTLLVANRECSMPFNWKKRKCVIFSKYPVSASPLVVYDFINKEIIYMFHINCFPSDSRIIYISNLSATSFLICLSFGHIFTLSFETSAESPRASFVANADIKCCALSPDNLYIACCCENSVLTVRSVDNAESFQSVVLKQPPETCWWSELYLWVVCKGVVVKYPYDSSQRKVLGNELEECTINFDVVLEFTKDVLIVRCGETISIFKFCNEKLCRQQISDLNSLHDSATVSSDGCAVLLHYGTHYSNYQLWEIACENRWELHSTGMFDNGYYAQLLSLTGTKNSRSSLWLDSRGDDSYLSSFNFSTSTHCTTHRRSSRSYHFGEVIHGDSKYIIVFDTEGWIHFVKLADGKITASVFLGEFAGFQWDVSSFYIASQSLLLLVGKSEINIFKIHNIENY